MKQKQTDRVIWWFPNDFYTFNKNVSPSVIADTCSYTFKGYVCPECNMVYQFTPKGKDEPLIDFPTYGKDRKVCKDCA